MFNKYLNSSLSMTFFFFQIEIYSVIKGISKHFSSFQFSTLHQSIGSFLGACGFVLFGSKSSDGIWHVTGTAYLWLFLYYSTHHCTLNPLWSHRENALSGQHRILFSSPWGAGWSILHFFLLCRCKIILLAWVSLLLKCIFWKSHRIFERKKGIKRIWGMCSSGKKL